MIQIWLGLWGLYSHWWWWSSSSSRFDDCIQGKGYFIIYDYNYDYDTPIYTLTIYSKMLITIAMPWRHQTQRWCCWYAIWSVTKTPVVDEFFFSINGSIEINKWNEKKIFHCHEILFGQRKRQYYSGKKKRCRLRCRTMSLNTSDWIHIVFYLRLLYR